MWEWRTRARPDYCLTGAARILSTISLVRSAQARIGSPSAHFTSTVVAPSPSMSTLIRPALGGEWSGAALVATENAPKGKRAIFGTFPQLGAPLGFVIANGLFLIIAALLPSNDPSRPSDAFLTWGWRIPFLFSAVMVVVGLWVRLSLVESAAFERTVRTGQVHKIPLAAAIRTYWRELILGTFYMLATYVLFYLMTTFSLSYGRAAVHGALPGSVTTTRHSF
jgi:hypothetical protein